MSKTRDYIQRKAVENVPGPVLDALGKAVLKGVDRAVEDRWETARVRAAAADGLTIDDRVRSVSKSFSRELTTVGVATGAAAVAPVVGTSGAVSLLVADIAWFAFRATDLIMTIGAIYGHDEAESEERRAWVLAVLAFGEEAADEFAKLAGEIGESVDAGGERVGALVASVAGGDAATVDALRRMNTSLASKVVTKYGSRRGMLSIGKLLPFGIGAVVGGSANWALSRGIAKQSRRFFTDYHLRVLPPPPELLPPVA